MTRTEAGSPAHRLFPVAAGVLLAGLALLAAACGSQDVSSGGSPVGGTVKDLEGRLWTATQIAGVDQVLPTDEAASTATFVDGTVAGSGGVNSYSAAYVAADDGTIEIRRPASTLMAGPPAASEQERAFFEALTRAAKHEVAGEAMKLLGPEGELLVTFAVTTPATLTGTTWSALAYNNGKGALQSLAEGSEITAVFGEDWTLSGTASVNTYSTTYTAAADGTLSISDKIAVTEMAGPEEYMAQEQAYLAALPQAATYEITGDELWVRDAGGAALAHYVAK